MRTRIAGLISIAVMLAGAGATTAHGQGALAAERRAPPAAPADGDFRKDAPPPLIISIGPRSGGPAPEVPTPGPLNVPETPSYLLADLRPNTAFEEFYAPIARALHEADRGNDGLDREDLEIAVLIPRAEARAGGIAEILDYDLDGDFSVSRREIERSLRGTPQSRKNEADRLLERFDWNSDGTISMSEAAAYGETHEPDGDKPVRRVISHTGRKIAPSQLLGSDPNGDGRLTADELRSVAYAIFSKIDSDGDGLVSAEEYRAVSDQVRVAGAVERSPACPLTAPSAGSKVLVFSAYEGDAISSVWIGGPDEETNVIDVAIEPGKQPLYLVLTSYESVVWRMSGDTRRVERVVVNSYSSGIPGKVVDGKDASEEARRAENRVSAAGVTGISADKVTIVKPDCWRYFTHSNPQEAGLASALIERSLGRPPEAIIGAYSLHRVSLPSGDVTQSERDALAAPQGFDAKMWKEAIRFWPGGLTKIDANSVVAQVPVGKYQVLPSQMGLSQLIGAGAIEYSEGRTLRVTRPIAHLPPSMGGAHSATLVLAKGVPLPPGDPVHACILSEDSEEPVVKGPLCPRAQ